MGRNSNPKTEKKAKKKEKADLANAGKDRDSKANSLKKVKKSRRSKRTLLFYLILLSILWSAALGHFYVLNKIDATKQAEKQAALQSKIAIEKDVSYYQWLIDSGKLYKLLPAQNSLSNNSPNSANTTDDNAVLKTSTDETLININPDEMLLQSQSQWKLHYGALIHVIHADSMSQLNDWERNSFESLVSGKSKIESIRTSSAGKEYIRVMLPVKNNVTCIGCDATDTVPDNNITSALVLSFPMSSELAMLNNYHDELLYRYGSLWLIGLVIFIVGGIHLFYNIGEWDLEENILNRRMEELTQTLNIRTQDVLRLQRNQQQFIENIDAAVYIRNREHVFTVVNERFAAGIGIKPDAIVGTTGGKYINPSLADYLNQHEEMAISYEEAVETGDFELPFEGSFKGVVFPTKGIYGQVDGVVGVFNPQRVGSENEILADVDESETIADSALNSRIKRNRLTIESKSKSVGIEKDKNNDLPFILNEHANINIGSDVNNESFSREEESEKHEHSQKDAFLSAGINNDFKEQTLSDSSSQQKQKVVTPTFGEEHTDFTNSNKIATHDELNLGATKPVSKDDNEFAFSNSNKIGTHDELILGGTKPVSKDDNEFTFENNNKIGTHEELILGATKPTSKDDNEFAFANSNKIGTHDELILAGTKSTAKVDNEFSFADNNKIGTHDELILAGTKPTAKAASEFTFADRSKIGTHDELILAGTKPTAKADSEFTFADRNKIGTHDELILSEKKREEKSVNNESALVANKENDVMSSEKRKLVQETKNNNMASNSEFIVSGSKNNKEKFAFAANSAVGSANDDFIISSRTNSNEDSFAFVSNSNSHVVKDEFVFVGNNGSKSKDEFAFASSAGAIKDKPTLIDVNINKKAEDNSLKNNLLSEISKIDESKVSKTKGDEQPLATNKVNTLNVEKRIDSDEPKAVSGKILNILVIDDSENERDNILEILQKLGHIVTVAENGYQAIEMYGWGTFDLLFMDIQMPVMNGVQATAHIRKQERSEQKNKHIPIIAMVNDNGNGSSNGITGDINTYRSCGMDNFIIKPADLEHIEKIINDVILNSENT